MAGSESYVQVPTDDAGKKLRTRTDTVGANTVHQEVVSIADPTTVTQIAGVDASSQLKVVEASGATIAGDTTSIDGKITACNTGDVTIGAAIPAGANIVGKVGIDQTTPGTTNRVDIGAALPTGANAIGKLAANSGVDIGDVDVTSIVPGTAATSLGKAEDAAHASGDTGVAVLAVRDDAPPVVLSGATGDYEPLHTDGKGQLYTEVHQGVTYDHAHFDFATSSPLVAAVGGLVTKLHAITVQAQGTVVVNLTDGANGTSLMEWSFQAREGAVIPLAPYPAHWLQTSANTALYVQLSAAQQVTINAIYSDEDAS